MFELDQLLVNGYAYPFVAPETLDWWLPRLTWVSTFSYGFTTEGDLINLEDEAVIQQAAEAGVGSLMVLTPLDENGAFNDQVAAAVFENPAAQDNLIGSIQQNIQSKGMSGVDFDFEYLAAEYADDYVNLVRRTRERLAPLGYTVTVALAPKVSANQPGLLYQGHDYRGMGAVADYCLIMTYEWGYTYGTPMAVAPITEVRRVVEYAVTRIPPEKINLGIPNYGYDWTLPFVQGESKARVVGNVQAVQIAASNGAEILYDERAKSPYFTYYKDGVAHEVWFEDVRSMEAKFALVQEYGLKGMGYWQIMRLFLANWLLLADTFRIRRI